MTQTQCSFFVTNAPTCSAGFLTRIKSLSTHICLTATERGRLKPVTGGGTLSKVVQIFNLAGECIYEEEDPKLFDVGPEFVFCTTADAEGEYRHCFPTRNVSEIREMIYNDD